MGSVHSLSVACGFLLRTTLLLAPYWVLLLAAILSENLKKGGSSG
jgi:hypothetical protein